MYMPDQSVSQSVSQGIAQLIMWIQKSGNGHKLGQEVQEGVESPPGQ